MWVILSPTAQKEIVSKEAVSFFVIPGALARDGQTYRNRNGITQWENVKVVLSANVKVVLSASPVNGPESLASNKIL